MYQLFEQLPIWAVYILTFIMAIGAAEIGYEVGKVWQRRVSDEKDAAIGGMVGSTLGLLAFLLAFVTGIAVNRYDNRRALVVEEANAIGTTYLRAGYLGEPYSSESRALLSEYVDVRLSALVPGQLQPAIARSEEIHDELWSTAEILALETPDSTVLAIYIESLNEVIDLHTKRLIAALSARIPSVLWAVIFTVALLTMGLVGFNNSYDKRRSIIGLVILAIVFTAVIGLIVDLDRPQSGLLRVGQQALLDLQAQIGQTGP